MSVLSFANVLNLLPSLFISLKASNLLKIILKITSLLGPVSMPDLSRQHFASCDHFNEQFIDIRWVKSTISFALSKICIRDQFLMQLFIPYIIIGILPNSRSTPIFAVCTPNNSLQNRIWAYSLLGYFWTFLDSPKNRSCIVKWVLLMYRISEEL